MIIIGVELVKEIIEVIGKGNFPDDETKQRATTIKEILATWLEDLE